MPTRARVEKAALFLNNKTIKGVSSKSLCYETFSTQLALLKHFTYIISLNVFNYHIHESFENKELLQEQDMVILQGHTCGK